MSCCTICCVESIENDQEITKNQIIVEGNGIFDLIHHYLPFLDVSLSYDNKIIKIN